MTRTTMFAPLFAPLPLGARTASNRIVPAPMSVCYGDERGFVTRPQVDHYAIRTCPCEPPTCLRTQLTGAVCNHWPAAAVDRGYLGYED